VFLIRQKASPYQFDALFLLKKKGNKKGKRNLKIPQSPYFNHLPKKPFHPQSRRVKEEAVRLKRDS
jgi:hypothetical protein